METINYLLGYENLKIYQDTEMFNFSLDSVLLPNFVTITKKTKRILDIGTGNAVIPMILTTKTDALIDAVEIQKDVFELGKQSIELNNLQDKINIMNQDIKEYSKNMETDTYDVITCNPPFFKVNKNSNLNNSDYKTIARHEVKLNLSQLLKISRKLLKNNGILGIVHRPDRLTDILVEMRSNNIEPKKIRLVYPRIGEEANILLIEGTKNGNVGLKILPPLYVHDKDGNYTEEVLKYFEKR